MAVREATVPDIGGYDDVPVIEVLIKVGDTLSEGAIVALIEEAANASTPAGATASRAEGESTVAPKAEAANAKTETAPAASPAKLETPSPAPPPAKTEAAASAPLSAVHESTLDPEAGAPHVPAAVFDAARVLPEQVPHASPAVRAFARELGVDLSRVKGSERGGRISRENVSAFVKDALGGAASAATGAKGGEFSVITWPKVDFARFGEITTEPLAKIRKISGANLARNWAMIPHVTQFDRADITGLEALRVELNEENAKAIAKGALPKLTMLAFLVKAVVAGLQKFPGFNASLDAAGETLTLKKYFHIGFAADTPNGLVVPVIRDCDRKGVMQIAIESGVLAAKARDGKLGPAEMSGGCFSISSLGGIGGTAFTPIVNAPEVAILGVSKSDTQPVWNGAEFAPRLLLPLSLSYDHRVIDGAAAARFTAYLAQVLGDFRRVLL